MNTLYTILTSNSAKPADKPASIVGDEGYDDDMSVDESPK